LGRGLRKMGRVFTFRAAVSNAAQSPGPRRAVFLDRDGTLIVEKNYLSDPNQVELAAGVPDALRELREDGFLLILVTNQSGIGRGYYTEADFHAVQRRMEELLAVHGVRIDRVYFAPEAPEAPSRGRKPSPQFLFDARDEFGLDLGQCYMIGDKLADLECGWNAGVKASVLVRTGYGSETERRNPDAARRAWVVDDLPEARARIRETEAMEQEARRG
jgi:D-glycero-D-manno-heptose 1,7-bisphosphate phosphatase